MKPKPSLTKPNNQRAKIKEGQSLKAKTHKENQRKLEEI